MRPPPNAALAQTAGARARALLVAQGVSDAPELQATRDDTCLFRAGAWAVKVWPHEEAGRAARQAARQRAVAAAMPTGVCRAPEVTAFADGVLVMPWVEGPSLAGLCRAGEHTAAAGHAGGWLRAFHAPSARHAPFRPRGHVNWLDRLIVAGTEGARTIPDLPGFVAAARGVQRMAPEVRGKPARKAVTHRDMTLSNLMWDGACVWGLDFENDREDEALRDVFTVLLDLRTLGAGGADGTESADALRAAYGDHETAPEVRLFLQRCFALWVWANTPAAAPSARHVKRLSVAQALLGDARPSI